MTWVDGAAGSTYDVDNLPLGNISDLLQSTTTLTGLGTIHGAMTGTMANPAFRGATFDEVAEAFKEQVRGLLDGGCDLLLVETIFDTLNAKAAIVAIEEVFDARFADAASRPRLVMCCATPPGEPAKKSPFSFSNSARPGGIRKAIEDM